MKILYKCISLWFTEINKIVLHKNLLANAEKTVCETMVPQPSPSILAVRNGMPCVGLALVLTCVILSDLILFIRMFLLYTVASFSYSSPYTSPTNPGCRGISQPPKSSLGWSSEKSLGLACKAMGSFGSFWAQWRDSFRFPGLPSISGVSEERTRSWAL